MSERCARRDFVELFGARALTNMIVINELGSDVSDLLVTVRKIRRGEIFGLEKYFVWGIEPRAIEITRSADRAQALAEIGEYARSIGVSGRLRASIELVADEFLSNALYNAPLTVDGFPWFASHSRTIPVQLEPGEVIELRCCCDGQRFGLSTADPFGSLDPRRIQEYLARGFRGGEDQVDETSGGARLGFFQILEAMSHFVVNIDPGHRTEMIGLVDISGGYRSFASGGKSFNRDLAGRVAT